MRAAYYERNGAAADVLTVANVADAAEPAFGEVRVRLETSGVNPSDVKSRAGRPLPFDRIVPHSDGAGVVEAVGQGVERSRIGERVYIWNGQWKRPFGTAAEAITLPSVQAVRLPDHIGFEQAACFGIPALTAMHGIRLAGPLIGRTMLITGAASGVGHYAVQMAAQSGARAIGTASAERRDAAMEAGCHHVIDYKSEDVADAVRGLTDGAGADIVLDMDLSSTAALLDEGILRPHGTILSYGSNRPADLPLAFTTMLWNSLTLRLYLVYELTVEERQAALEALDSLLQRNALTHRIAKVFDLDDTAAAHEAVEGGTLVGNVVLRCR